MTEQHTPGPWKVNKRGHVLDGDGNLLVPWDTMADRGDIEVRANAHLIAAAPDLYVIATHPVLEQILKESNHPSVAVIFEPMRRAAIAKAEGRQT